MNRRTNHASITQHCDERVASHDLHLAPGDEPPLAAHLVTPRRLYTHHGIYIGDGRVVHYAGLAYRLRRGPVEQISLERFAHGRAIWIRDDQRRFGSGEVVERARSRLGESRYRVLTNNCEHFCTWVLRDECRSDQVERFCAAPRVIRRAIRAWYERIALRMYRAAVSSRQSIFVSISAATGRAA